MIQSDPALTSNTNLIGAAVMISDSHGAVSPDLNLVNNRDFHVMEVSSISADHVLGHFKDVKLGIATLIDRATDSPEKTLNLLTQDANDKFTETKATYSPQGGLVVSPDLVSEVFTQYPQADALLLKGIKATFVRDFQLDYEISTVNTLEDLFPGNDIVEEASLVPDDLSMEELEQFASIGIEETKTDLLFIHSTLSNPTKADPSSPQNY